MCQGNTFEIRKESFDFWVMGQLKPALAAKVARWLLVGPTNILPQSYGEIHTELNRNWSGAKKRTNFRSGTIRSWYLIRNCDPAWTGAKICWSGLKIHGFRITEVGRHDYRSLFPNLGTIGQKGLFLPNFGLFWHYFDFFCKRQKISEEKGASCDLQNWRPNVTQLVLQILWRTSTENFILERYIFPGTKPEKTPYLLNGWSICFEPLRLILGLVPTWPYILSLNVSGEHLWN